jgi:hypothetical protein
MAGKQRLAGNQLVCTERCNVPRSIACELSHGLSCAVVIDQGLAGRGRGDQRGDGGIVECAWEPQADFVQPSDGVVGEERISATDQLQVMAQVLSGLGQIHGRQLVASGNPLVKRGEHAEPQLAGERRLADEQQRERALRIHLGVGQQAQLLELIGCEQVRLVDDEHDATTAFVFFGGQQGLGLRDQFGFLGTWSGTQRVNKGQVQPTLADRLS